MNRVKMVVRDAQTDPLRRSENDWCNRKETNPKDEGLKSGRLEEWCGKGKHERRKHTFRS